MQRPPMSVGVRMCYLFYGFWLQTSNKLRPWVCCPAADVRQIASKRLFTVTVITLPEEFQFRICLKFALPQIFAAE